MFTYLAMIITDVSNFIKSIKLQSPILINGWPTVRQVMLFRFQITMNYLM